MVKSMKVVVHLTIEGTIEIEEGELHLTDRDYGKLLKKCRQERGFTLTQLSRLSGVSASHIGRIEREERSPGITIVAKLERALKE